MLFLGTIDYNLENEKPIKSISHAPTARMSGSIFLLIKLINFSDAPSENILITTVETKLIQKQNKGIIAN